MDNYKQARVRVRVRNRDRFPILNPERKKESGQINGFFSIKTKLLYSILWEDILELVGQCVHPYTLPKRHWECTREIENPSP